LEDLRMRLDEMDLKYPLCVVGSRNNPGSRLNYNKALEDRVDGVDFLMLVFVPAGLVSLYKGLWPNQILIEIPFDRAAENIRDITRQAIKSFGSTLGTEYVYIVEDDVYAAYRSTDKGPVSISMYEYLQEIQSADKGNFPLIGSRSVSVDGNITPPAGTWTNDSVSGLFLLRTSLATNFVPLDQSLDIDVGLTRFNQEANNEGIVQKNQTLVLRRGYTTYDPVGEDGIQTLLQRVRYKAVNSVEPEQGNLDLRVAVVSNKVVQQIDLPDDTRWVRSLAVVGDETASIILIGTSDEQVQALKPGNIVDIRGAKVQMLGGFMRLIVDRGMIILSPDQTPLKANESENASTIEYELMD